MNTKRNNVSAKATAKASLRLALMVCLTFFLLTGCSLSASNTTAMEMQAGVQTGAPSIISRAVIIDTTSSTAQEFSESVCNSLIEELGSWGGEPGSDPANGEDGIPGLELWIFVVGGNPTASDSAISLHISLPGIAGLGARPGLDDENFHNAIQAWNKDKSRYEDDLAAWQAACDSAVAALQDLDIHTNQRSDIFSTIAATSLYVIPGADLLLASDLENTKDPQQAGDLSGSKVYVLQPIPSGDMAAADTFYSAAVTYLTSLGVKKNDISRYPVEQMSEAVHAFMYGD